MFQSMQISSKYVSQSELTSLTLSYLSSTSLRDVSSSPDSLWLSILGPLCTTHTHTHTHTKILSTRTRFLYEPWACVPFFSHYLLNQIHSSFSTTTAKTIASQTLSKTKELAIHTYYTLRIQAWMDNVSHCT